jgi:hypothetical protein
VGGQRLAVTRAWHWNSRRPALSGVSYDRLTLLERSDGAGPIEIQFWKAADLEYLWGIIRPENDL